MPWAATTVTCRRCEACARVTPAKPGRNCAPRRTSPRRTGSSSARAEAVPEYDPATGTTARGLRLPGLRKVVSSGPWAHAREDPP
jgi:hypothetical protein